jgi:tRNA pseudouridine38-40 synthase
MNYRLLIQYDGTDFHGWQIQKNQRTVEGDLTAVLSSLDGAAVHVSGSGRTDAGVHAEGQVANVHLSKHFEPLRLRGAINGNQKRDVRILEVQIVPDDFHARFSATGKTYVYRIINAPVISPFWARYALHEARALDLAKMHDAARLFLGEHDWTAFSSARTDAESKVREITELNIKTVWDARANANLIEFTISANGFLRYMVRSIVGTLLEVGRGKKNLDDIQRVIKTGDKQLASTTAAAHGLTLLKVFYD